AAAGGGWRRVSSRCSCSRSTSSGRGPAPPRTTAGSRQPARRNGGDTGVRRTAASGTFLSAQRGESALNRRPGWAGDKKCGKREKRVTRPVIPSPLAASRNGQESGGGGLARHPQGPPGGGGGERGGVPVEPALGQPGAEAAEIPDAQVVSLVVVYADQPGPVGGERLEHLPHFDRRG